MISRITLGNGYTLSNVLSVNAAGYCLAFPFYSPFAGSLTSISFINGANGGTVTNIGRVRICPTASGGGPDYANPIVADQSFTPSGGYNTQTVSFTGVDITANTIYYIVFSNADGTPATNYYQVGYDVGAWGGPHGLFRSINSGSSWYSTGTVMGTVWATVNSVLTGYPYSRLTNSNNGGKIYRTASYVARQGLIFTVPAPMKPLLAACGFYRASAFTSPRIIYEIYQGNTKILTSFGSDALVSSFSSNSNAGTPATALFEPSHNIVLLPNNEYKLVALFDVEEGSDTVYIKPKQLAAMAITAAGNITHLKGGCYASAPTISSDSDWTISRDASMGSLAAMMLTGTYIPRNSRERGMKGGLITL